jgi:dimethylaniline monooxygenase (N-oxide forming)
MTEYKRLVDVCVVGAGWSGLLACKHALENNLSVVVLERRENLGGVWNFTEDVNTVTVMDSTVTSSSAIVTEASDFPFNPELGNFLHRKDIHQYLEAYAEHFNLYPHIHFNQNIVHVEKQDHWIISSEDQCFYSRNLVICAGPYQKKREHLQEIRDFTGDCSHIGRIKSILPESYSEDDNVLVYGGGESASDIVDLLTDTSAKITWSIPNGQHFFRKTMIFKRSEVGKVNPANNAIDSTSSRCIQHIVSLASANQSKPGMKWLCTLASTGSLLGYEGHGIPEWRKNVPFLHAMINKNGHAVEYVQSGRVTARGKIKYCENNKIIFEDGSSDQYTHIILCTGYQYNFPYLPSEYAQQRIEDYYKLIFNPDDPSLLLLGYARPILGSIPQLAEAQCLYSFQVLAGKISLPKTEDMLDEIEEDIKFNRRYFHNLRGTENLVNPFIYGLELATFGEFMPNYTKFFFRSPRVFFKTFFSPFSATHFRLNDENLQQQTANRIWNQQSGRFWFTHPLIYLVARILRFDVLIEYLQKLKYNRQVQAKQEK